MFTISIVYKLKILLDRLRCGSITLMVCFGYRSSRA